MSVETIDYFVFKTDFPAFPNLQFLAVELLANFTAAAAAKSLQSCLTVQPHRRKPIRLRRPWDSPGKNTGVGCHFLLQCMKVKSESGVAQSCPTLRDPMDCSPPGSSVHGIFQARALEWGAIAFSKQTLLPHLKSQGFLLLLLFHADLCYFKLVCRING